MTTRPDSTRRTSIELRFTGAPSTLPSIGGRTLYQYWSLLAPHFRPVLLPPQWRAEDTSLAWSWREPATNPPPSVAELAALRKRLAGAQRSITVAAQDAATPDPRNLVSLAQLQATTAAFIEPLLTLPDNALSAYVARTDTGLTVHSWGLPAALTPSSPDSTEKEISGTVFTSRHPAPGMEVLLETANGHLVTRVYSNAAGSFNFPKVPAGHYRVRVTSHLVSFPAEGTAIEVLHNGVTGVELHEHASLITRSINASRRRRRLFVALFILLLVIIVGLIASSEHDRRRPAVFSPTQSPQSAPVAVAPPRASANLIAGARAASSTDPLSIGFGAPATTTHPARFRDGPSTATAPAAAAAPTGHSGAPPPKLDPTPSNDTVKNSAPAPTTAPKPQASLTTEDSTLRSDRSAQRPSNSPEIQPAPKPITASPSKSTSTPPSLTGIPEQKPPASHDQPTASDQTPASAPPTSSSTSTPSPDISNSTQSSTAFVQRLRLRLSPWQPRLLRDTILPTQPTRTREAESIDALRAQLFREQQARLPASFQQPDITIGFALDLPADTVAHWQTRNGSAPLTAFVSDAHAEITLPSIAPHTASPTEISLYAGHRELARVAFDFNGEATLAFTTGVRAWPWIAFNSGENSPSPLTWQVLRGQPAAATWRSHPPSIDSRSFRLDLIPTPNDTGLHQRTLALIDEATGWAIVSEITTAIEAP